MPRLTRLRTASPCVAVLQALHPVVRIFLYAVMTAADCAETGSSGKRSQIAWAASAQQYMLRVAISHIASVVVKRK